MKLIWTDDSWDDYLYWQQTDKKTLRKINELVRDIMRHPFTGIGKPEPLKENYSGCWARRITQEHRLVYKIFDDAVQIVKCRYHYD